MAIIATTAPLPGRIAPASLALLLALLAPPMWANEGSAASQAEAAAQGRAKTRAEAIANGRARTEQIQREMDAEEQASVDAANEYMDGVRDQNESGIAEGKSRAEDYGRNNPVDGYPDTEVRVQEEWVWDPELDDYRLEWQYRLVYKDSLGNAQYEAYFDQDGNVTTPLRESPWRIANQRVQQALGDENDGPFQVAWGFSEDNFGREYPTNVIVQAPGLINRVQMRFNEFGEPYFWDIRDEDGDRQSFGHGLSKPQYTDDGPPLDTVEPARPATGPCEECRPLLEARNDLLIEMVPLANRINQLAGQHARLNQFARDEQAHVQDFGRIRQEHGQKLRRYRGLESRFNEADAAWRACEQDCLDAQAAEQAAIALGADMAASAAAVAAGAANAITAGPGFMVTTDQAKFCRYLPEEMTPIPLTSGGGNVAIPIGGQLPGIANGGGTAITTGNGGSMTQGGTTSNGGGLNPGGTVVVSNGGSPGTTTRDDDDDPKDTPTEEDTPQEPTKIYINVKASSAAVAQGAQAAAISSVQVKLIPTAVANPTLPGQGSKDVDTGAGDDPAQAKTDDSGNARVGVSPGAFGLTRDALGNLSLAVNLDPSVTSVVAPAGTPVAGSMKPDEILAVAGEKYWVFYLPAELAEKVAMGLIEINICLIKEPVATGPRDRPVLPAGAGIPGATIRLDSGS